MKRLNKILALILAVFTLVCLLPTAKVSAADTSMCTMTVSGTAYYQLAADMLPLINAERASVGVGALTLDEELTEAAMQRAVEIAVDFSHTRPDGSDCSTICRKLNGENIAAGFYTTEDCYTQWKDSPGHYANMIEGGYESIGIGCFSWGGTYFWVQIFSGYPGSGSCRTTNDPNYSHSVTFEGTDLAFNLNCNLSDTQGFGSALELTVCRINPGWGRVYCAFDASNFTWTSSDTYVASVNAEGSVKFTGCGTTVITAECKSNPTVKLSKEMSVRHDARKTSANEWKCVNCGMRFADQGLTVCLSKFRWERENSVWYYYVTVDGAKKRGWLKDREKWYYMDASTGAMQTGWKRLNGTWYYLDAKSGVMQTGWTCLAGKWYYLHPTSGAMQTGWAQVSGKWYYLGTDGVMQTGWKTIDGVRRFFSAGGQMQTGWVMSQGKWYYLGTNGAMRTGWVLVSGKWYYLGTDGVMRTGWQLIGGKWYYLTAGGVMTTGWQLVEGKWYYFGTNGAMQTGWHYENGKWYYLKPSNGMACGESREIDGKIYEFDAHGVCTSV